MGVGDWYIKREYNVGGLLNPSVGVDFSSIIWTDISHSWNKMRDVW